MKPIFFFCTSLILVTGTAFAADSPWAGIWKLDETRSQLTGETFTISQGPGDLLHYSDGGTISYDFNIDGREYKSAYNRTTTWRASGKDTWDQVTKIQGKVLARSHRTLSSDGKILTMEFKGTRPDGSAFDDTDVYTRVSGTDGLLGTWRSVKAKGTAPATFVISEPTEGVLRFELPEYQESVEGRADGTDHPIIGPMAPPGFTSGFKFDTPMKIRYVLKVSGKPDTYGVCTLALDAKSYTDESWSPGKESEKTTAVYTKQ